jgi:hypothetical protein
MQFICEGEVIATDDTPTLSERERNDVQLETDQASLDGI